MPKPARGRCAHERRDDKVGKTWRKRWIMPNESLMRATLELAVPLWIEQVRHWPEEYRAERRQVCGQAVAERGDVAQYRSKKKGESAEAFNRLAEGLALLAFAPGGVTFLGVTWKAGPHNEGGDSVSQKEEVAPGSPEGTGPGEQ